MNPRILVCAGAAVLVAATAVRADEQTTTSVSLSDERPIWTAAEPEAAPPVAPAEEGETAEPQEAAPSQPAVADLAQIQPSSLLAYRRALARTPYMFGDGGGSNDEFGNRSGGSGQGGSFVSVPSSGAAGRLKVSENNRALTDDRVFFLYNHFHNSIRLQNGFLVPSRSERLDVDRFTLGVEKSFACGLWSVETRIPMATPSGFGDPHDPSGGLAVSGGNLGDIAMIFKRILWQTNTCSLAGGLAIDLPTGDDVDAWLGDEQLLVRNEAVHLTPFLGVTAAPTERWFWHAFVQMDFPTASDSVDYRTASGDYAPLGEFTDQTLLYFDGSVGYWLYERPCGRYFTGLAGVVELHYTTTVQDTDVVAGVGQSAFVALANPFNRVDLLNLAAGLHAQLGPNTSVRVAAVAPLRSTDDAFFGPTDRVFDAELHVSINRRF